MFVPIISFACLVRERKTYQSGWLGSQIKFSLAQASRKKCQNIFKNFLCNCILTERALGTLDLLGTWIITLHMLILSTLLFWEHWYIFLQTIQISFICYYLGSKLSRIMYFKWVGGKFSHCVWKVALGIGWMKITLLFNDQHLGFHRKPSSGPII